MSAGARRGLIPLAERNLDAWAAPDINALPRNAQDDYLRRRTVVEMYAGGARYEDIRQATGTSRSEVRRLVMRCVVFADDGAIYGFRALVGHVRTAGYRRTLPVSHCAGEGSGGCAGALTQLLDRWPEVDQLLNDLFFKEHQRGQLPEARQSIATIHERFKRELRKLGLTDSDWPFNTANCGYKSLAEHFKRLRKTDYERAAPARSGIEAARRNPVGNGLRPLFPSLRPYGAAQLDFHKVDGASIIVLTNDHGKPFEVPLARWHFGLLVEEKFGAALGFCVALELTPSGDSTLETIASAVLPQPPAPEGVCSLGMENILINQLMPELACQGFSVLKVDNGWSNAAHEVVNNIIDTVGCAINFGPTRAWWRRNLIERIFGELTRRGLQRMPSTLGNGPGDTRRNNANEQAIRFRIELDDLVGVFKRCLREHNTEPSEGLQWSSPMQCLQAALAHPASGLFPQPLPVQVQQHPMLMMHVEEVTVRGNEMKGVRPYFNLDRHKHTNVTLANSFHLIGKKLLVYVNRLLARDVHATVLDTGESLGQMYPSGPWKNSDCSWRDRKLMGRAGMTERYHSSAEDPLETIKQEKIVQLASRPKSRRSRSSATALEVAKIEQQQKRAGNKPRAEQPQRQEMAPQSVPRGHDPFGLNIVPDMSATKRGRA